MLCSITDRAFVAGRASRDLRDIGRGGTRGMSRCCGCMIKLLVNVVNNGRTHLVEDRKTTRDTAGKGQETEPDLWITTVSTRKRTANLPNQSV